jgi:hypothetical protein
MVDICGSIGHRVQGDELSNSWRLIGIRFFVLFVVVLTVVTPAFKHLARSPKGISL